MATDRPQRKYILEDHMCRNCGGRILRCVSGTGATGGGNPVYECSQCGAANAAMGPSALCWCGFAHRGQDDNAYECLPFSVLKERPYLRNAFLACGCDPDGRRAVIGIVLVRDLREALRKAERGEVSP